MWPIYEDLNPKNLLFIEIATIKFLSLSFGVVVRNLELCFSLFCQLFDLIKFRFVEATLTKGPSVQVTNEYVRI